MYTEVKNQQLVTVTMSVEEWAEWLGNPQTLLIQIQNLALAVLETSQQPNGHKPRKSPKGKTARVSGTGRASKTLICTECNKRYKTKIRFQKHMDRMHTSVAKPAAD